MVDDSDFSVHLPPLPMSLQWLANNTTQQMHLATQYTTLIIELKMGQSVVWRRRNARRVRAKNFSPLLRTLLLLCCTSSAVLVPFLTKASTDRTLRKNLSQSSAEPPWFPTWEALHLVDVKIVWIRKRLILDYFQHDLTHQCDPKNWRNPSHSRMCDSCPSAAKKTDNFYPQTINTLSAGLQMWLNGFQWLAIVGQMLRCSAGSSRSMSPLSVSVLSGSGWFCSVFHPPSIYNVEQEWVRGGNDGACAVGWLVLYLYFYLYLDLCECLSVLVQCAGCEKLRKAAKAASLAVAKLRCSGRREGEWEGCAEKRARHQSWWWVLWWRLSLWWAAKDRDSGHQWGGLWPPTPTTPSRCSSSTGDPGCRRGSSSTRLPSSSTRREPRVSSSSSCSRAAWPSSSSRWRTRPGVRSCLARPPMIRAPAGRREARWEATATPAWGSTTTLGASSPCWLLTRCGR